MSETVPDNRAVVAETLRVAAYWLPSDRERRMLLDTAREVAEMAPDDPCCALCEEVICDEGCPLKGLRIYEPGHPDNPATPADTSR